MPLTRKIKDLGVKVTPSWVFGLLKTYRKNQVQAEYGKKVGTARRCNFCDHQYSIFAPFNNRADRMCPSCFSLERHRLLLYYLRHHTDLFERPQRVLHFAAERCIHDIIRAESSADYHTADLMVQFLPTLEIKPMHKMSITEIGFPDAHFDLFLCNHVLEHVPDDRLAMREIYRVLKPGGRALLTVPINPEVDHTEEDRSFDRHQRREFYGSQHHLRYYGAKDFMDRLTEAGFDVAPYRIDEAADRTTLRIDPEEIIFVCRK